MSNINERESKSIFIIRETYSRFKNPAILWSGGKDSTALLWLCKEAFFNKIPMPVIYIDTGYEFEEVTRYRSKIAKELGLNLLTAKNDEADRLGIFPEAGMVNCCHHRKTLALRGLVEKHGFDCLMVGIRRDEHGIRNKERYFSPRDKEFRWNYAKIVESNEPAKKVVSLQDAEFDKWNIFATEFGDSLNHVRVHPLLHWSESDIWDYILKSDIPVLNLYLSKNNKRFRSIGCKGCTSPIESDADDIKKVIKEIDRLKHGERDGRLQDNEHEYNMQKLRSLGYM